MKNYTNKKTSRAWLIIIALILVLFGVFLIWNYFIRPDKPQSPPTNPENNQPIKPSSNKEVDHDKEEQNTPSANNDGKTPTQNEGDNPNTSENFTGFITNKNINSTSQQLTIRVTIDQLVQPAGTCTLRLTSAESGSVVTKTAPTIDNPSYSSCQGFDIPLSELSSGKWRIDINVRNATKSGNITSSEVVIP